MKWLILVLTLLFLFCVSTPGYAAEYACDSCSDCSSKIRSALSGDVVKLTADIYADSATCININMSSGVTFNCQWYTIDGGGSYTFGIFLNKSNNVVKNCRIQGFNYGIFVLASHNIIDNIVSSGNSWAGIDILGEATNNTIRNSVFKSNTGQDGYGVLLTGNVTYNRFINVTSSSNKRGLSIQSSSNHNTFTGLTVKSNTVYGINMNEIRFNIIDNSMIQNNPVGIRVGEDANSNLIYNNYFDNPDNAEIDSGINDWNITKTLGLNIILEDYLGGNFWSDYSGQDLDGDGLGDSPYDLGMDNYDYLPLVHPPSLIKLVPPTPENNSVLGRDWVFINASANEILDSCLLEWNGVNESVPVSGGLCYKNKTGLDDGNYSFRVWGNDSQGNLSKTGKRFITISTVIPDTTPPTILYAIQPRLAVSGSNVSLMINASDPSGIDKTWLTITLPDSASRMMYLENRETINYTASLIGRYNVTFFANDTLGNKANASDYFDAQESITMLNFTVNVVNNTGGDMGSNLTIYYTGTSNIAAKYQFDGRLDGSIREGTYDFEFGAYDGDLRVLLREINLSQNTNKTLGLGRPYPGYGFTHIYVVNNTYTISTARVRVFYVEPLFANENYLGVYICEDWDFEDRGCDGDWNKTTVTQNKTLDYFDIEVFGFSAFSIKQEPYCGDGICLNENSSSCPEDCECDAGATRPCNVTHKGWCAKGMERCEDGSWTGCPEPETEICDEEDNDCDGIIDNVFNRTSVQETQCRCYAGGASQNEKCNGIDDDCDGEIDEGGDCCDSGETRECGPSEEKGICRKGTMTCVNNVWDGECEGAVYAKDETCGNGEDDDCDDEIDEECWDLIGLALILIGIIILIIIIILFLHFRSKGKELTWEELRKKWGPAES